jgi:SAM-dependent methyltransferase
VLLALKGARVVGIDLSAALVDIAAERARINGVGDTMRLFVTSAHALPFADNSFDMVFGSAVLHHLDLQRTAAEVFRVLRPAGRAIFKEPVRSSSALRAIRASIPYCAPDVSPFERVLTDADLELFAHDFILGRSRPFSLPHINMAQLMPGICQHMHKLFVLDAMLLRSFPALTNLASSRVFELVKKGADMGPCRYGNHWKISCRPRHTCT